MNVRTYGKAPYHVAVVHGGPGALGSVKVVCEELSKTHSVIEPLQTKKTVEGQLLELKEVLKKLTKSPIILIGHSWGAMLVYMFASRYPKMVKKIILVSSGSLEHEYSADTTKSREQKIQALSASEKIELKALQSLFANPNEDNINKVFARYGALMEKIDAYDPVQTDVDDSLYNYDIFKSIWEDAVSFRKTGAMHAMGSNIACDVVAIHGDYDSHPAYGIKASLEKVIEDLRFVVLEKCGHTPWLEKYAQESFYKLLRTEIKS